MEIRQKKNSNKVGYVFKDDELEYSVEDGSGSRSFSVPYSALGRDRQTLVERNQWLRNVGLIWIVLGAALTGLSLTGDGGFRVSFWLWVGLICYGIYHFRFTKFTIVPTERGNLLIIDDEDGARILKEIDARRVAYLRKEYDFLPEADSPEKLRGRVQWLHREGALSDEGLRQRLLTIDALDVDPIAQAEIVPPARLN